MSNIRYTAVGNVTGWQWADGTAYAKTYDVNNRLKTFPLGNTVRTLSYDSVGNITGWDDNGDAAKAKHFSYDLLDRLDGYTAANEVLAFQYDPNGNRTAKTDNGNTTAYALQPNSNRLAQVGNITQAQDANGNLLNDGSHTYTYNAQNRLASVDGTTAYSYNADDQRVKKTTPTGTTLYAWNNDRIIGEYATTNGAAQQATETVYFGNTPVAVIQNGNIYRIYADQIDTPRVITDATGKTVWAWDSKPFGETLPDADPDKDGLALHYNQRFPGQTFDAETGLHYNFHRDYNPATGRYVQSDPIGLDGGMNTFGYVGGCPLSLSDLSGYVPTKIGGTLNRTIDFSIDIHSSGEIPLAKTIMQTFPKLRFTVYVYARDISGVAILKSGGAKVVGLHMNPLATETQQLADAKQFYTLYRGTPASIHGNGTLRLPARVMSALAVYGVPFVRAGSVGNTGGTPPIKLSYGSTSNITTFKNNSSISHYFLHPNSEYTSQVRTNLIEFSRYAQ